jgi:hypothetical protein
LAGAIVPGVARYIVMLSAHADVFGVGITAIVGSMLAAPSCVIPGWMVPDGEFAAISGVESGKAAPLVGGPPGTELHTVVEGLPSAFVGEMLPVVVATIDVEMVPSVAPGVIAVADIVMVDAAVGAMVLGIGVETVLNTVDDGTGTAAMEGVGSGGSGGGSGAGMVVPGITVMAVAAGCANTVVAVEKGAGAAVTAGPVGIGGAAGIDGIIPAVPLIAAKEIAGTAAVPGVICPVGVAQVTTVPGVVGSDASGTGANVVSAVPGWVVAENGLGP